MSNIWENYPDPKVPFERAEARAKEIKSEFAQIPKQVAKERALDIQVGGAHYKSMRIQPLEFCVANKLGPCESAIIKYISRWREKGGYEDLRKIKHYVDLLIELDEKYPLKIGE